MTVGEDLFGVVIAVGLISMFVVVWCNSFIAYRERHSALEESRILLSVSDYLVNGALPGVSPEPGLVHEVMLERRSANFTENLASSGLSVQTLIATLEGETLFRSNGVLDGSSVSVSLPIVYENCENRIPARLIVRKG